MVKISYHVSHEQFSPRELLGLVRHAESAGFDCAFSSDHIQPWLPVQGQSGNLWTWLGAAMQATQQLSFSAITIPAGWRYHPAVVAHAVASLGEMFPSRLPWIALGSGEALNECVVGADWPDKSRRDALLREAADIVRRLLQGEGVTRDGPIPVTHARIWSRPAQSTLLMGAALTEQTAAAVGEWADGLLTTAPTIEALAHIAAAFQRSTPGKPMHAKIDLSWAPREENALMNAHEQWRYQCIDRDLLPHLRTPEQFEAAAAAIQPRRMHEVVLISSQLSHHVEWLRERAALGFETLDLHNVGRNQHEFIEQFGAHVLPALRA